MRQDLTSELAGYLIPVASPSRLNERREGAALQAGFRDSGSGVEACLNVQGLVHGSGFP